MGKLDVVRDMAFPMAVGEQMSGLRCPLCESTDNSFSLKREISSVKFMCHRAKCGYSGVAALTAGAMPAREKKEPKNNFLSELVEVPEHVKKWVGERIEPEDYDRYGVKWAPNYAGGRLALPVRGPFDTRSGYNFRSLAAGSGAKAILWLTDINEPAMSWCKKVAENGYGLAPYKGKPLVVVEDQMSAYKVSHFCSSVALLGTNMSDSKLHAIVKVQPSLVVLALDEDATAKASSIIGKISGVIDNVRLQPLSKDFKDMSLNEVRKELNL